MREEALNPCPVSFLKSKVDDEAKIVKKAEHEKEDLKTTLKKDFNIDADTLVATYPTLEQLNLEKDKLFREGRKSLLSAAADPNKQLQFSAAIKAGVNEINTKMRIAELLKKYKAANVLIESLNKH